MSSPYQSTHTYADDTTIYASSVSTVELYAKVNNDLTRVRDWLLANKLSLNVTKMEYMFLTTTFKLSNLGRDFPIKIGNNHVKRVQTTKYLGIHLDENLKWNKHVDKLCSKVNRSISGLKQARHYCTIRCSKYYLQISYPACVRLLRRCLGQFRPGTYQ